MLGPNIIGETKNFFGTGSSQPSGAFSNGTSVSAQYGQQANTIVFVSQVFNANNSDSTYIDNGAVRPKSLAFNYIIKS